MQFSIAKHVSSAHQSTIDSHAHDYNIHTFFKHLPMQITMIIHMLTHMVNHTLCHYSYRSPCTFQSLSRYLCTTRAIVHTFSHDIGNADVHERANSSIQAHTHAHVHATQLHAHAAAQATTQVAAHDITYNNDNAIVHLPEHDMQMFLSKPMLLLTRMFPIDMFMLLLKLLLMILFITLIMLLYMLLKMNMQMLLFMHMLMLMRLLLIHTLMPLLMLLLVILLMTLLMLMYMPLNVDMQMFYSCTCSYVCSSSVCLCHC